MDRVESIFIGFEIRESTRVSKQPFLSHAVFHDYKKSVCSLASIGVCHIAISQRTSVLQLPPTK